jgi:hypothetical protein
MGTIQIQSRVGKDGVLSLEVPLGSAEANTDVIVTIRPTEPASTPPPVEAWHEFVQHTYGSCATLGLEEPTDLPLQQRNWD